MTEPKDDLSVLDTILTKYQINETIDAARIHGWTYAWDKFDKIYNENSFENDEEKYIFTDLFFSQGLKIISPITNAPQFWDIVSQWFNARKLESRNGNLTPNEKIAIIHLCLNLRAKLREFLIFVPLSEVAKLKDEQQRLMIVLWRQLFFEPFTALNLYWNPTHIQTDLHDLYKKNGYPGLLVASMFEPFAADDYNIDAEKLVSSQLPFCYKTILIFWMVNTPYFNAEEKHRQKLMKYIPDLCRAINRHSEVLNSVFFLTFVQEVMTGLWRGSYIGGNNIDALSAFGDFISFTMNRFTPFPKPKLVPKNLENGEKIRIGYISRNFYKQAVSCYMVNRVIYHDPSKFEVYTFALGDYHDDISDFFKNNSAYFERFENMTDIKGIAEAVRAKNLDILIYTDIGMDPVTYILSGLQLAPVQCAMVGHGTSTGMPTIQYYISGDFESPEAQQHYREKLIRLPNLGAAQYLPIVPESKVTRQDLGIPSDAVVFISCANGIKHGHLRDNLFVEILKQAPNAWIVLKPFATHASIDRFYTERFASAAREAGVADRFIILPPIGQTKHVMGLLDIADVQLDSYPYGGWTTNMEALYMGLPIVTQEGSLARSRWGAGMLRALGIYDGIASNEQQYIEWAVRFAQNEELRVKLKRQIQAKVQDTLFNGPGAQPAFEEALLNIYQEECRRTEFEKLASQSPLSHPERRLAKLEKGAIPIATSLVPGDTEIQKIAVKTWIDAGFHVISINAVDDIAALYPIFPDVEFAAATRDARGQYGKPYIYFDDILTYFQNRNLPICGIISPDLCLLQEDFQSFIKKEAPHSFIYGSRVEVDSLASPQGQVYNDGFDYFFFDRELIQYYPKQEFCLSLPWWDYWAVIAPLMRKLPVKKVTTPATLHVKHSPPGSPETWLSLGMTLASHLHPPFPLSPETMTRFAVDTLTIINKMSLEVSL